MAIVLSVFPDSLNMNGDAQNALVLSRRATWSGIDSRVVDLVRGASAPSERPDLVVVGSGAESALASDLAALRAIQGDLRSWSDAGVPILAVGAGWALLAESVELAGGEVLAGIGLFAGRSAPHGRVSDDIVVDSQWGRLVGYENHARSYELAEGSDGLGRVVYGAGNSADRIEGERAGALIGTHLHGPVLAKNPSLADHLLTSAFGDSYSAENAHAVRVDALAAAARARVVAKLDLSSR